MVLSRVVHHFWCPLQERLIGQRSLVVLFLNYEDTTWNGSFENGIGAFFVIRRPCPERLSLTSVVPTVSFVVATPEGRFGTEDGRGKKGSKLPEIF